MLLTKPLLVAAIALTTAAAAPGAAPTGAAPVIAAERAFAADAAAHGIKASFLRFAAPDAIVFAPDQLNALQFYGARPAGTAKLAWWPAWAGVARSGDLGFTTGPFMVNDDKSFGRYFTVWARQPGGGWKWVFDGGVDNAAAAVERPATPPRQLAPASAVAGSAARAMAEVRALEAKVAATALQDYAAALRPRLALGAMLMGSPAAPATTPAAYAAEFAARPGKAELVHGGGGASSAGDLAWTYGEVRWLDGAQARRGHYVRVWQDRKAGWALVFDEFLPVEPAK